MIHGIDVASYQSATPDLTGQDFCVVKATQGTTYVSAKHASQVATARAKGLVVGHYHFVKGSGMDAQADYFLSHAAPQADEFLVLDWESPDVTDAEKGEFIAHLKSKAGGRKVGLYCNLDYWTNRDSSQVVGDFLWIADPSADAGKPRITHAWTIHQYSSAGGTDHNVANFTSRSAMATWAGAKPVTPAKPVAVDLSNVIRAFSSYPRHPAGASVAAVQKALTAEKLYSGKLDGIAGPKTKAAYKALQKRYGYSGVAADGIPGKTSLTRLGHARGFTVKA